MRMTLMAAAAALTLGTGAALAADDNGVCPSGQVNAAAEGSPVRCVTDATATTPAPDIVEDAGEVVKDAGQAVKDAGEAVGDAVSDTVKEITN